MKAFADLHDALAHAPQHEGKLRLLVDYLARTPDPDRGWALAALAGAVELPRLRPAALREMAERRLDPVLLTLSLEHVDDLAETVSLIWPGGEEDRESPRFSNVISILQRISATEAPDTIETWLQFISISERYALLKLLVGGLKVGVSASLVRTALARYGGKPVEEIEALWHDLTPPFAGLFRWLDGAAPAPQVDTSLAFRPLMRTRPLEDGMPASLSPTDYAAEWQWDGIRVLLAARGGEARLYTKAGDEIGRAFPDLLDAIGFDAVLDGTLLVLRDGTVAPLAELQRRLGRRAVPRRLLDKAPAHLRLSDMLFEGEADLRSEPFVSRRQQLETWHARTVPARIDLSPLIPFADWPELAARRDAMRDAGTTGLVLKRRDGAYPTDRAEDDWLAWPNEPFCFDSVLMYVEHGPGASQETFTIGCWRHGGGATPELVPIGRIGEGLGEDDRAALDQWARENAVERYGPVLAVNPRLVCEVAFATVDASSRHKAGLVLRHPRLRRIRWDRPAASAGRLETLARLAR